MIVSPEAQPCSGINKNGLAVQGRPAAAAAQANVLLCLASAATSSKSGQPLRKSPCNRRRNERFRAAAWLPGSMRKPPKPIALVCRGELSLLDQDQTQIAIRIQIIRSQLPPGENSRPPARFFPVEITQPPRLRCTRGCWAVPTGAACRKHASESTHSPWL